MDEKGKAQPNEQYFSASPTSDAKLHEIAVELGGTLFRVQVGAGVFSGGRLDKGSEVLLRKVPPLPSTGVFVDVGCGWGPLTLVMAHQRPDASVYAVDVNARGRELTSVNATVNGLENVTVLDENEAFTRLTEQSVDVIWSNPPIRIGKDQLHALWCSWLPRLKKNGVAYLVMGKNLGSDSFLQWAISQGWTANKIASSKGFRVLELRR